MCIVYKNSNLRNELYIDFSFLHEYEKTITKKKLRESKTKKNILPKCLFMKKSTSKIHFTK